MSSCAVTNPLAATPQMKAWAASATQCATNTFGESSSPGDVLFRKLRVREAEESDAAEFFSDMERPESPVCCADLACLLALGEQWVDTFPVHWTGTTGTRRRHDCAACSLDRQGLLGRSDREVVGAPHKVFQCVRDIPGQCHYGRSMSEGMLA